MVQVEWEGKWLFPCRSASERDCLHMAMGLTRCVFFDSARQSATTTLSRRVRGVLSRGPKERSRESLMCWGK